MKIKPINFADFDLVEIKTTNECSATPHCKKHGAMNKFNILEDGGGYWRCTYATKQNDNACRAGCQEIGKKLWRICLLRNHNIVHYESKRQEWWRCWLMGIIWKYMPDLTFKNRNYMIYD